jgi:hypothetical protein
MTLSSLGYHIAQMISYDTSSKYNLVPDPLGVTLHSSNSLLGGVWYVVWLSLRSFDWNDRLRPYNLGSAVNHVYSNWQDSFDRLQERLEVINTCLRDMMVMDTFTFLRNEDYQLINDWHFEVILTFKQTGILPLENKISKINAVFKKYLDVEENTEATLELLYKTEELFSLFKVKTLINAIIPFELIKKISMNIELSSEEETVFITFAKNLLEATRKEDSSKKIYPLDLHRAMICLISSFEVDDSTTFFSCLGRIYYTLNKVFKENNSSFFTALDPSFNARMQKLLRDPSKVFKSDYCQIPLGNEITLKCNSEASSHRVFNTEHHSFEVYCFGQINPFQLFLEYELESKKNYGLPLAEVLDIHPSGIIIKEKLSNDTVATYPWIKDGNQDRLEARINSLSVLFKHMLNFNYTPVGFSSDYIRFDTADSIKFTKFFEIGPFDADVLMDLASECLGDNLDVYSRFIKSVGLQEHIVSKIYLKSIGLCLENKEREYEIHLQEILRSDRYKKEDITLKARHLKITLEMFLRRSKLLLLKYFDVQDIGSIDFVVKTTVKKYFESIGAISILLRFQEEDVVFDAINTLGLTLKDNLQFKMIKDVTRIQKMKPMLEIFS